MASEFTKRYPVELILYLTDLRYLNLNRLNWLSDRFEGVTLAGPCNRPETVPESIRWHGYEKETPRAHVWNQLLNESQREWALFLVDDEKIRHRDLPDPADLSVGTWYPAQMVQPDSSGGVHSYYQMRLVTAIEQPLFDGENLPDCTRVLTRHGVKLSRPVLRIGCTYEPYRDIQTEEELSGAVLSPQVHLLEGKRLYREKKYVHATAYFRRVLKCEKLLPFDRLAALNGLVQCYTEQYKWNKAVNLAHQSIEAEPRQRIPWLVLFRIFQLRQQWEEAYSALESYHKVLPEVSMANFDKSIAESESLELFVKMALRAGKNREALDALEKLVALRAGSAGGAGSAGSASEVGGAESVNGVGRANEEGDVNGQGDTNKGGGAKNSSGSVDSLYRQILDLSVELKERQKASHYFSRIHESLSKEELHDVMSGFMENGWYDLVSDVYTRLYEMEPENPEYGRRLIASLTKQGKLQEARELVSELVSI